MNTKKVFMDLWKQERDAAIKSQDVETFKAFYAKWRKRGIYYLPIPNNAVLEVSLRKMLYHLKNATQEEKDAAEKWLHERGFTTDLGRGA